MQPKWTTLPAAEWIPDQPDYNNPGTPIVKNCLPGAGSYRPLASPMTLTSALGTASTDYVRGAISTVNATDVAFVFAGNAGNLYQLSATVWDEISKTTNAYTGTATTENWMFVPWAQQMVALKYLNLPQVMTLGSPPFADLGGSPPRARFGIAIRDYLMLGGLAEGGIEYPNRVRWSGFNNIAAGWSGDIALGADHQDLFENGWITGMATIGDQGAEYGVVFQQKGISLVTPAQPPLTWRFDTVEKGFGCEIPGSIVQYKGLVYYIGPNDFYVLQQTHSEPLGAERVAATFHADLDQSYLHRVSATIDPTRQLVFWLYPGSGNVSGAPNKMIVYNWATRRFAPIEIQVDMMFSFMSPGYTLEGLDAVGTNLDTDFDPISLDSDAWKGGTLNLAAFQSDKLATFTGTPLDGVVETAEMRPAPGQNIEVTNTRPLVQGGSATVSLGYRKDLRSTVVYTAERGINTNGECNIIQNRKFMRARVTASGTWEHIIGVDVYGRVGNTV